ncbi:MAG: CHASE3 domain-containing protein [Bacteroidota bacterium]
MKNIHSRSKRNLLIGFGFSLIILIVSSGISYISINQLVDSQQWVEHTALVESNLENIISRMKDAETGQRGFLLTEDEAFLDPYTGANSDVASYLTTAQILTRDNKSQQNDFYRLEQLIDRKFSMIDKSISDKKKGIPATVSKLLWGKSVMDSIRNVVKVMVSREQKLMITRSARMNRFATYSPAMIGIAAFIAMIITFIFYFRVERDSRLAIALQNELISKEEKKQNQIAAISDIAEKIAKGNYSARIDRSDLE